MTQSDTDWGVYLPTAGLIIGWVDIAMGLLEMVAICVALFNVSFITNQAAGKTARSRKELEALKIVSTISLSFYLVLVLCQIFAAILLIVGVSEDHHKLLLPWLIINTISIIVRILTVVYLLIMTIVDDVDNIVQFLVNGIMLAILIWLWLIILSLYRYIRDKQ